MRDGVRSRWLEEASAVGRCILLLLLLVAASLRVLATPVEPSETRARPRHRVL
jgi:hypothetical protein